MTATAHGLELLALGYTVDQVVHDYGDLCQAITDLAFERDDPFSVDEFRSLNRCLDNVIADAVTEFSFQRDEVIARQHDVESNERVGALIHELRNALGTAVFAVCALESSNMPVSGATGAILKRSLTTMTTLIDRSITAIQIGAPAPSEVVSVASFISDARDAAQLAADDAGCRLWVPTVDPVLGIRGNRELLLGALANLLQNAFKFTHPHTEVTLCLFLRRASPDRGQGPLRRPSTRRCRRDVSPFQSTQRRQVQPRTRPFHRKAKHRGRLWDFECP